MPAKNSRTPRPAAPAAIRSKKSATLTLPADLVAALNAEARADRTVADLIREGVFGIGSSAAVQTETLHHGSAGYLCVELMAEDGNGAALWLRDGIDYDGRLGAGALRELRKHPETLAMVAELPGPSRRELAVILAGKGRGGARELGRGLERDRAETTRIRTA